MQGYRIIDEPHPGAFERLTVNPFWPLLGLMLGGAWLGWIWFAFNSFAIGSATKGRELGAIAAGVLGSAALFFCINLAVLIEAIPSGARPYLLVLILVWKLLIGYYVYYKQSRSFALHLYFGGMERNGFAVVAVAFFLREHVIEAARIGILQWVLA